MPYKLIKIPMGTSTCQLVSNVNISENITGLCYVNDLGFLFLVRDSHCIGLITNSGKIEFPWMGEYNTKGNEDGTMPLFEYPSSICYSPTYKICYLLENGGSKLRNINVHNKYASSGMSSIVSKNIERYFSKSDNYNNFQTYCDIDDRANVYWIITELNRCMIFNREYSIAENYIGNGRSGFSTSNCLSECLMNKPRGLRYFKGELYICDANNHCIRKVKDRVMSIVAGNPMAKDYKDGIGVECLMNNPSSLVSHGNIMYFIDNNKIRYLSLPDHNVGTIYESNNITSIEINNRNDLLVLEKV